MRKLTTEEFISKAKLVHGDKYDYSLVEYTNNSTKIKIMCIKHGVFEQIPNSHLLGVNCPKCHNLNQDTNSFVNKAKLVHGDKYDYSNIDYKHSKNKVRIICPEHGEFLQTPNNHLAGKGCYSCSDTLKLNTDLFIEKSKIVHNDFYDYTLVDYKNSKTKVLIYCPIHGGFEQQPDSHLQGIGCPNCSSSKGELAISNFLVKNNIHFKQQHKFDNCKYKRKLPFDFYIPSLHVCIEFDGKQHFKPVKHFGGDIAFKELLIKDKIKTEYCMNNNIRLIRIKDKNKINKTLINEILKIKI